MSCSYVNRAVWRQTEAGSKGGRAELDGSAGKRQRLRMDVWKALEKLRMKTVRSLEFAPD